VAIEARPRDEHRRTMPRLIPPPSPARRGFLAGVATLVTTSALPVRAESRPLTLATSTPGGGFALYGETLERVLNRRAGRALLRAVSTRAPPRTWACSRKAASRRR
jgi:hypothetical protein